MFVTQFNAKNQFIVNDDNGNEYLQSYNSIIVKRDINNNITLSSDWDYSITTGRYRNLYLNETKKETVAKIASGVYKIDNTL